MTTDKFIYLFGKIIPSLSLVLSMCLRFVPMFVRKLGIISDGQKCVGRSASNGSVIKRAKHGITIFSILVTWALENAIETADSMKCRGYGEKGRTAFSLYYFDRRDLTCLIFMIGTFGMTLYGAMQGFTYANYNPVIVVKGLPLTAGSFVVFASYGLFCLMPVIMELYDREVWKLRRRNIEKSTTGGFRLWEV